MAGRRVYAGSALLAILAFLVARFFMPSSPPPVVGRANVVLFLVNGESGLSNVHLATAQSILENHPEVTVHVASFAPLAPKLDRVTSFTTSKNPSQPSPDVVFHQLTGPNYARAIEMTGLTFTSLIHRPGLEGIEQVCRDVQVFISPWSGEDHYQLYHELIKIIDEVDPGIVVLDTIFRPGIDAVRDRNRLHAFISPNTLIDNFFMEQPYLSFFWKYPMSASGIPYPVPWGRIPENVYLTLRFVYSVVTMSDIKAKQSFLKAKGLGDPINFYNLHRPEVPWFTQTLPGASLPVYKVPQNVTCVGPMSLSLGEASEQDPDLAAWMAQRPTVLINLGSGFTYTEARAATMVLALARVLKSTDLQVLWKFGKHSSTIAMGDGNDGSASGAYSDDFLEPLKPFIDGGRVKMTGWLSVDPTALLKTGHVVAAVHHGGAGCYHEAIEAGVPQVILPQWFDLYNFAHLAEYIGVGVWGCPESSPDWTEECLEEALLRVARGSSGQEMQQKAKILAEEARNSPGQEFVASEIVRYAAAGKVLE